MSKQQLVPHIAGQVVALQRYGPQTTLPRSKQALNEALSIWRNERSQTNQEFWRLAALAHGAAMAFAGNWEQAVLAYDVNPNSVWPESNRYSWPETPSNIRLAALMHINLAVALIRYNGPNARQARRVAERGLAHLKRAQASQLVRWYGVALAAQSYGWYSTGYAAKARRYADQAFLYATSAQPRLRQLLASLTGDGAGQVTITGFQASECLYYFNE